MTLDEKTAAQVMAQFSAKLGGVEPEWTMRKRPDGSFIEVEFIEPSERIYKITNEINARLSQEIGIESTITVKRRTKKPLNRLRLPETSLLQKILSESLTIDQYSFEEDFETRYIPSVSNFEQTVTAKANHVVFGRRGAGKSSLLAYGLHTSRRAGYLTCWISMQLYAGRSDRMVIAAVLGELLVAMEEQTSFATEINVLIKKLDRISVLDNEESAGSELDRLLPQMKRLLSSIAKSTRPLFIYLDDMHVLNESLQPTLLGKIYALTRANNCYLKISGIEQLTKLWNASGKFGLEAPHDAQLLRLDYNLTMPDRSLEHIKSILDAHAVYCGLPGISYLVEADALNRLVLAAAAVPRDALALTSAGLTKATLTQKKSLTVTSINAAASEAVEGKLQDIEKDASVEFGAVSSLLEKIKIFCITTKRKNAFLVRIQNSNSGYLMIQKLIALRLVHVLHEGTTPYKAGERFIALMLDFGFYTGIRAATSVDLFPDRPRQLLAAELRKLPVFVPS
ncbi:MAG: ATP-binding protein [Burkholderiales bacterium]|nr:ATP-binding protein [Burkholderiales bacterium]